LSNTWSEFSWLETSVNVTSTGTLCSSRFLKSIFFCLAYYFWFFSSFIKSRMFCLAVAILASISDTSLLLSPD